MGLRVGCCCLSGRDGEWPCGPGEQTPSPTWALEGFLACEALMKVSLCSPPTGALIPLPRRKCGRDLGGAQGTAWCRGPGASASPASRGLMAWRDAHLGKGTCQPHLLAGWGLLPVFLLRQAGRSPAPSCGQYHLTQHAEQDCGGRCPLAQTAEERTGIFLDLRGCCCHLRC